MLQKIQSQLHSFLFPQYHGFKDQSSRLTQLYSDRIELQAEVSRLQNQLIEKEIVKPTIKDYMREVLGLEQIDFTNVDEQGIPPHFLNIESKELRKQYISELYQIQKLEVFQVLIRYLINTQGNYIIRNAENDLAVYCGRMTLNGISLVRNEVRDGFDEYMEGRKPEEEFDKFETDEGIDITKLLDNANQ